MAIYPGAVVQPIPRFTTPMTPVRVNLHTAVSDAQSLHGFFSPAGRACSHFYVSEDGTVYQYVDTKFRAAADLQGNPDTVSIETWDGYPRVWRTGHPPAWNAKQLAAMAKLLAWIFETHKTIPAKLAENSRPGPSSHGLSWHRLGIDGNFYGAGILGRKRVTGGLKYSSSRGKVCPGDNRIRQIPALLEAAKGAAPATKAPAKKTPAKAPAKKTPAKAPAKTPAAKPKHRSGRVGGITLTADGSFGRYSVLALQHALRAAGQTGHAVDGDFGAYTVRSLQRWLRAKGQQGHAVDGDFGAYTVRSLQRVLRDLGYKGHAVDGDFGRHTITSLQHALIDGKIR